MGKTVPSYRMALEEEIDRWKGFRKALPNEEEREAFDELMDMYRSYASEGNNAKRPFLESIKSFLFSRILFCSLRTDF
jgi:hypothetical protein